MTVKGHENLIVPTSEKARINGAKGGAASGEAKRKRKLLRDCLNELLDKPTLTFDEYGNPLTTAEVISIKAIEGALNGDWKAFELVRDTSGQKPVERIMIADVDAETLADVERLVEEELEESTE